MHSYMVEEVPRFLEDLSAAFVPALVLNDFPFLLFVIVLKSVIFIISQKLNIELFPLLIILV